MMKSGICIAYLYLSSYTDSRSTDK